jgi:hypothetical protein
VNAQVVDCPSVTLRCPESLLRRQADHVDDAWIPRCHQKPLFGPAVDGPNDAPQFHLLKSEPEKKTDTLVQGLKPVESGSSLGWPTGVGSSLPFSLSVLIKATFTSISMNFFEIFSSKYHGEKGNVGLPAGCGQLGLAAVSLLHSLS